MPRIKSDERFVRVLRFLLSIHNPDIASLMAMRGFDEQDRAEGWALLDMAAGRHLSLTSLPAGS